MSDSKHEAQPKPKSDGHASGHGHGHEPVSFTKAVVLSTATAWVARDFFKDYLQPSVPQVVQQHAQNASASASGVFNQTSLGQFWQAMKTEMASFSATNPRIARTVGRSSKVVAVGVLTYNELDHIKHRADQLVESGQNAAANTVDKFGKGFEEGMSMKDPLHPLGPFGGGNN